MVSRSIRFWKRLLFWSGVLLLCHSSIAIGQTTAFTYQGKLTDTGNLANNNYDFQFKLFDTPALGTGNQQGATVLVTNVTVTNGIFSVTLDFGACASCFNGSTRYLEIAVKLTSDVNFTTLGPRQQITSTPYALRSVNAAAADGLSVACFSCVTSSQIGSVNGSAVAGTIPVASVPAGSANYIQNATNQQASSNFNISGDGTAGGTLSSNIVNAATQFNIGGSRVLSNAGSNNLFVGRNAGIANTTGGSNAFFGSAAGLTNTSGAGNAFFGTQAGQSNSTGAQNSFFGYQAGISNTTADNNAFFGAFAGVFNTTGTNNTFVGMNAGRANTTGSGNAFFGAFAGANTISDSNAFFGYQSGQANTSGFQNSFFGYQSGQVNTTGDYNAFFGAQAGQANTTGDHNAFFGAFAGNVNTTGIGNAFFGSTAGVTNTTGRNNSFFGTGAGEANATGDFNSFFGTGAGELNTTGSQNSFFGLDAGIRSSTGSSNTFIGAEADFNTVNPTGSNNTLLGASTNINSGVNNSTAIGSNASVTQSNALVLGSINGVNGATADTFVGIGTTAPAAKLHVSGGAILLDNNQGFFLKNNSNTQKRVLLADTANILHIGSGGVLGFDQIRFDLATPGTVMTMLSSGNVGIGTTAPDQLLTVNGNASKVGGGSWAVFSDERLKIIKGQFQTGLQAVMQLQPIRYEYKADNALGLKGDGEYVGFSAQAVEKVLPEAVSRTSSGYLQLNSDPILWTMLNAIKEQQQQIETQQERLRQQQQQIEKLKQRQVEFDALKRLVCADHPTAALCKEN